MLVLYLLYQQQDTHQYLDWPDLADQAEHHLWRQLRLLQRWLFCIKTERALNSALSSAWPGFPFLKTSFCLRNLRCQQSTFELFLKQDCQRQRRTYWSPGYKNNLQNGIKGIDQVDQIWWVSCAAVKEGCKPQSIASSNCHCPTTSRGQSQKSSFQRGPSWEKVSILLILQQEKCSKVNKLKRWKVLGHYGVSQNHVFEGAEWRNLLCKYFCADHFFVDFHSTLTFEDRDLWSEDWVKMYNEKWSKGNGWYTPWNLSK